MISRKQWKVLRLFMQNIEYNKTYHCLIHDGNTHCPIVTKKLVTQNWFGKVLVWIFIKRWNSKFKTNLSSLNYKKLLKISRITTFKTNVIRILVYFLPHPFWFSQLIFLKKSVLSLPNFWKFHSTKERWRKL